MLDWNKMLDRQEAGKNFLRFLIDHPKDRENALKDPTIARDLFQTKGGMTLPPEVEIHAVANSRPARDNFNVILVPDYDPDPDILSYWMAAWIPYGEGQKRP
jgi:hypothetical protein